MSASQKELLDLARSAARACLPYPFAVWNFGDSVYLDGLMALANADPECGAEFLAFAYGMTKAWVAHTSYSFSDHTAPGAALIELWRRTNDPSILEAAVRLASLWDRFPRCATAEAYLHTFQRHQNVAIDCAHFDGPYLARLAAASGEASYAERAVYELTWRLRLLQDERTGLCYHSYSCGRGRHGGVFWGRGQGWALLGLIETLRALPTDIEGRTELVQRLGRLAAGLVAVQNTCGHWHTVVDDRASYLESSVAAFFVAAVWPAIGAGLLSAAEMQGPVEAAWRAVLGCVRPHGVLDGVSAETPTTLTPEAYRGVPTGGVYPWGQGPLILATIAASDQRTSVA